MSKIKFRKAKISKKNLERLDIVNDIIVEYQNDGYVLTLRQLYYQLVSRDIIPNIQSEYAKLSTLIKEGRMSGIIDWDAIEDRLRQPYTPATFNNIQDVLDAVLYSYKLNRQEGQEKYMEVWVEKDALSGVLKQITSKYHIPILVNRGYSSASAMFDSFLRFRDAYENEQEIKIFYLGDFDPSGLDMIRDIRSRIMEFFIGFYDVLDIDFTFKIVPIALTKKQIEFYNPPPNPTKITDPRAKSFIEEHGDTSWEVDALKPETLNNLLEQILLDNMDIDKYNKILDKEQIDKDKMSEHFKGFEI